MAKMSVFHDFHEIHQKKWFFRGTKVSGFDDFQRSLDPVTKVPHFEPLKNTENQQKRVISVFCRQKPWANQQGGVKMVKPRFIF